MSSPRSEPSGFTRGLAAACLAAVVFGCGAHPGDGQTVLVETPDGPADAGTGAGGTLEQAVHEDATLAADLLTEALGSGDRELAAWAAAYVLRLGVSHDAGEVRKALSRGTGSDDPLLAALCWRWLAADPDAPRPKWRKGERPDDPVVGAMAALALAGKGKLPGPLRDALGLPAGEPSGDRSPTAGRVEGLTYLAGPYDTGPLALAVVFAEARREQWVEGGASGRRWAAERLREELYREVVGDGQLPAAIAASRAAEDPEYSALAERLETPLATRPPEVLRGAVLTAEGSLRIEAIRALAVASVEPAAGDLGAVAAAMRSPEARVRIEAARTFLLLVALATEVD